MPPELQNSPQYKDLTTSNDGTNVRPALQPSSYFFTDGTISPQTASQKFGVVSDTQYRGTTKFTCTGKIYTICQGQIFVQPQTGDINKVNVILKPFKQPITEIPIKYIIYRGLKRSDFFRIEGGDEIINGSAPIDDQSGTGTKFCQYIWSEFDKFHANFPTKPPFKAEMIGFPVTGNTSQQLTDLIDKYFYKIVEYQDDESQVENPATAYEFPLVPAGTELGSVSPTEEIGIDIILNDGDFYIPNDPNPFQFDLVFARASETIINASTGTDLEKKLKRQAATNFLDVAAFYGLHANGSGKLYLAGTTPVTLKTPEEIFPKLNSFLTKNTTYIYIQGNRQRYYNFYGNYDYSESDPKDIKIGNTLQDIQPKTFAINNWPVHALVPISNSVVLQLTTDNHSGAGLYVKTGSLSNDTPHEEGFIRDENIFQTPTGEENDTTDINYTKPITLLVPRVGNNSVSSVIELIYEGKQLFVPENGFETGERFPLKDIDDFFGLLNAESFVQKTRELELPSVMDSRLQLINFPNSQRGNDIGTVQTKRIEDIVQTTGQEYLNRVTYETLLTNMKRNAAAYLKPSSTLQGGKGAGSVHYEVERNNFYRPEMPYYFKTQIFTDSGETITGLTLQTTDRSLPTKKLLGITKDENQRLLNLVADNLLVNPKVYFYNVLGEDSAVISSEENPYKIYTLNIVAENSLGEMKRYVPSEDITVYTLDGFMYFTELYTKYGYKLKNISKPAYILKPTP